MRAKLIVAGVSIAALLGAAACTTTDPYSSTPRRNNTGTGVIAGALGGALLGYLTNTSNGEEGRKNALIGAGIGALAGGAVGKEDLAHATAQLATARNSDNRTAPTHTGRPKVG